LQRECGRTMPTSDLKTCLAEDSDDSSEVGTA